MLESFVDLTYRGLALGRRIKLTQVRASSGYLELPMPMPVGTRIAITTDEGIVLEATVTGIHEQVGGSGHLGKAEAPDRVPGMTVAPELTSEPAIGWWQARVTRPAEPDESRERGRPVTVRPRSHTVPQPVAATEVASEVTAAKELAEPTVPTGKRTTVMNAVDQEMLQQLTQSDGEVERIMRRTGEHEVVDDGKRTTVMEVVDPAALGLDVTASGSVRAQPDDGTGDDDEDDTGEPAAGDKPAAPAQSGAKKKRKKRR